MAKEKIKIIYEDEKESRKYREVEANRVPKTENFYVFKYDSEFFNAYSLTIIPSGIATMFFKYKKDANYMAKKLQESGIDFNRDVDALLEDEKLKELIRNIAKEINAKSDFVLVGKLSDFRTEYFEEQIKYLKNINKKKEKKRTVTIDTNMITKTIKKIFSQEEQDTFEKIVGEHLAKFLDLDLMSVGMVSLKITKIDEYMNIPGGVSMGQYVKNKFTKKECDIFKKMCCGAWDFEGNNIE